MPVDKKVKIVKVLDPDTFLVQESGKSTGTPYKVRLTDSRNPNVWVDALEKDQYGYQESSMLKGLEGTEVTMKDFGKLDAYKRPIVGFSVNGKDLSEELFKTNAVYTRKPGESDYAFPPNNNPLDSAITPAAFKSLKKIKKGEMTDAKEMYAAHKAVNTIYNRYPNINASNVDAFVDRQQKKYENKETFQYRKPETPSSTMATPTANPAKPLARPTVQRLSTEQGIQALSGELIDNYEEIRAGLGEKMQDVRGWELHTKGDKKYLYPLLKGATLNEWKNTLAEGTKAGQAETTFAGNSYDTRKQAVENWKRTYSENKGTTSATGVASGVKDGLGDVKDEVAGSKIAVKKNELPSNIQLYDTGRYMDTVTKKMGNYSVDDKGDYILTDAVAKQPLTVKNNLLDQFLKSDKATLGTTYTPFKGGVQATDKKGNVINYYDNGRFFDRKTNLKGDYALVPNKDKFNVVRTKGFEGRNPNTWGWSSISDNWIVNTGNLKDLTIDQRVELEKDKIDPSRKANRPTNWNPLSGDRAQMGTAQKYASAALSVASAVPGVGLLPSIIDRSLDLTQQYRNDDLTWGDVGKEVQGLGIEAALGRYGAKGVEGTAKLVGNTLRVVPRAITKTAEKVVKNTGLKYVTGANRWASERATERLASKSAQEVAEKAAKVTVDAAKAVKDKATSIPWNKVKTKPLATIIKEKTAGVGNSLVKTFVGDKEVLKQTGKAFVPDWKKTKSAFGVVADEFSSKARLGKIKAASQASPKTGTPPPSAPPVANVTPPAPVVGNNISANLPTKAQTYNIKVVYPTKAQLSKTFKQIGNFGQHEGTLQGAYDKTLGILKQTDIKNTTAIKELNEILDEIFENIKHINPKAHLGKDRKLYTPKKEQGGTLKFQRGGGIPKFQQSGVAPYASAPTTSWNPNIIMNTPPVNYGGRSSMGKPVAFNPFKRQQELYDAGYDLGKTGPNGNGVDGNWGEKSQAAYNDFHTFKAGFNTPQTVTPISVPNRPTNFLNPVANTSITPGAVTGNPSTDYTGMGSGDYSTMADKPVKQQGPRFGYQEANLALSTLASLLPTKVKNERLPFQEYNPYIRGIQGDPLHQQRMNTIAQNRFLRSKATSSDPTRELVRGLVGNRQTDQATQDAYNIDTQARVTDTQRYYGEKNAANQFNYTNKLNVDSKNVEMANASRTQNAALRNQMLGQLLQNSQAYVTDKGNDARLVKQNYLVHKQKEREQTRNLLASDYARRWDLATTEEEKRALMREYNQKDAELQGGADEFYRSQGYNFNKRGGILTYKRGGTISDSVKMYAVDSRRSGEQDKLFVQTAYKYRELASKVSTAALNRGMKQVELAFKTIPQSKLQGLTFKKLF